MLNLKTINVTPELLKNTCEIDEFKGAWAALEKHTTALQLLGDVAKHGQGLSRIIGPLQSKKIDIHILNSLHQLYGGKDAIKGLRKESFPLVIKQDNEIIGTLETATPEEVELLIPKLLDWLNEALENKEHHPLLIIGLFSAVFLQICPYYRGNQKLMKFLIILLMIKTGYVYAPYAPIEDLFTARAKEFYECLEYTQMTVEAGRPDWGKWLTFFLGILRAQKEKLALQLDVNKGEIANLPDLSVKIMDTVRDHGPRLGVKDIMTYTNAPRSTVKLRLKELVDNGYLCRHGKARATWYSLV